MTETTSITVADGKYTVQHENGTNLRALRHGEPWRDLVGDNLVFWMACRIEELEKESHENWCAEVNAEGRYEKACERVKKLEEALQNILHGLEAHGVDVFNSDGESLFSAGMNALKP